MRFCLLLVISLLAVKPVVAVQLNAGDAALLNQAQESLNNQQASAAITPLTQLLQSHPDLWQAHRLLGHAYAMTGQSQLARKHLVIAISNGQMTTDTLARLYQLDQADQKHLANLGQLLLLCALEPDDQQYPMLLAQTHESLSDVKAAESIYQSQLPTQSTNRNLLLKLGGLAIKDENYDKAIVYLQTSYELGENTANVKQSLSWLYAQNKQRTEALSWHLLAWPNIQAAPINDQLHRITLLWETGDLAAAKTLANQMVEQGHAQDRVLMMLAKMAMQADDAKEAHRCFEQLAKLGQAPAMITAYLGSLAFNQSDYVNAARYLAMSDDKEPLTREQLQSLFASYLQTNQSDAARQAMERYLIRFDMDEKLQAAIQRWAEKSNPSLRDAMD
jgi:Flp pilus assembly protein TadD